MQKLTTFFSPLFFSTSGRSTYFPDLIRCLHKILRFSFWLFINLVLFILFHFFDVLFLPFFLIFLAALVSHYISPFLVVRNNSLQRGFCCNHSGHFIINRNVAYFSNSVNYRFQERSHSPGRAGNKLSGSSMFHPAFNDLARSAAVKLCI